MPGTVVHNSDLSGGPTTVYQVSVTRVQQYYGYPEDFLKTAVGEMLPLSKIRS